MERGRLSRSCIRSWQSCTRIGSWRWPEGAQMTNWIGAAEAAERLGIKQASLYAYVSRGVLSRRREAEGRASMFDAAEVEELARKGRSRRTGGAAELVIESELTEITPRTQRYRGYDATDLALRCSFEDVAALLWTGSLPAAGAEVT